MAASDFDKPGGNAETPTDGGLSSVTQPLQNPVDHSQPDDKRGPNASTPSFAPGDVVADRFEVICFLARGGMGEVYEVKDNLLGGAHLALKTIAPEVAARSDIQRRFEREVLLARQITHPNVCPIYDFFQWQGPQGSVSFLTMKLLHGETLADRLRRGPLTPADSAPIFRQLAAALSAAHQAGIVHRDFKPGNIMLEGAEADVKVTVTDFGLAREGDETMTRVPGAGPSGTPGYLAPELIQGGLASPKSDIYALGVVLHMMLAGGGPERAAAISAKSGTEGGDQELPQPWDRIVRGCLEPDPAKRFQSAAEALAVLDGRRPGGGRPFTRSRLSRRQILGYGGSATLAVAGATWLGWPAIESVLYPLPDRRFVALMAWPEDPSSNMRPLLDGILDVVASQLVRAEAYVRDLLIIRSSDVPGQNVKEPKDAMHVLGANLVLAASLRSDSRRYRSTLRVLDAANGRILRERAVSASLSEAGHLPERAAVAAGTLLRVKLAQEKANDADELSHLNSRAYEAFTAAEELRRQPNDGGLDRALAKYQDALDADPNFALGYARLSMAYLRKFQITHEPASLRMAETNADRALKANGNSAKSVLSRALVLLYSGKTSDAMPLMEQAHRMDPGNPEIPLYQARAFGDLARPQDEERVYRRVVKDRPNFWPAYNELGRLLYRHGRLREALEAFESASAVAPQATLPLTNAVSMYLLLNRRSDAIEALKKSLLVAPSEDAYLNLGNISFEDHAYSAALGYYEKARDLNPANHEAWRDIGDCYDILGNRKLMAQNYAEAAERLSRQLKINPNRGIDWMTLAFYEAKAGLQERAEADIQAAEEHGATDVASQFMKAQAAAVLGRKEEALRLVLGCLDRGLSTVEVDLALDLKDIRSDPRYRNRAEMARSKTSKAN